MIGWRNVYLGLANLPTPNEIYMGSWLVPYEWLNILCKYGTGQSKKDNMID